MPASLHIEPSQNQRVSQIPLKMTLGNRLWRITCFGSMMMAIFFSDSLLWFDLKDLMGFIHLHKSSDYYSFTCSHKSTSEDLCYWMNDSLKSLCFLIESLFEPLHCSAKPHYLLVISRNYYCFGSFYNFQLHKISNLTYLLAFWVTNLKRTI